MDFIVTLTANRYQYAVIKALFLIFEPAEAWDRAAKRSLGFTIFFYLMPMLLILGAAEAFGLVEWGRQQTAVTGIKKFTPSEAALYESVFLLVMVAVILVSAHFVKMLGETFHGRHTYKQTFTVVIYGLSPVFLFRLLDVVPGINLWIPWVIGVLLMTKILYHGVPRVMEPDPPHALGLFFMSALLMTLTTAVERLIAFGYLSGRFRPLDQFFSQVVAHIGYK